MAGAVTPISIEKEYEKNPDITPEDIKKLREWLNTQPHLPGQYITDVDLLIVYHCCEKSMQVTKQVLDLNFTLRTLFDIFFMDRKVNRKIENCLNTILFAMLPTPTVHGYKAAYLRLLDVDPKNFLFNDAVTTFMMIFDLVQYEDGTWPGFVVMIDMDKAVLSHVTKLEVMPIKKLLYFIQECMFLKLKEVHFLNAPYFMDKLLMLLKPFLNKELLSILHVHQIGADTIYDYVPKKAFPKNDGGEYKDHGTLKDEIVQRLHANKEYFSKENRRRVNESLRLGGKNTAVQDLFGIQGSFKKLDLD